MSGARPADPPQTASTEQLRLHGTRLWHRVRRPLTTRRAPFMAMSRLRSSRSDLLVRPDSVLAIEAPMRSGNTFAAAAFSITNPDAGHVGRHIHTPAHVLQAVHLQIPTLVLVRDPRAVAVSHVIRRPALTVSDSLVDYSLFFETIEPVRDHLVAVSFEDLIEHFDSVIARLNDAFDTSFRAQSVTDEFLAAVTRRVEEMNRQESVSRGEVDERRVARPSASREALRAEPERQLESTENRRSLARAVAAYQRWRV